MLNTRVTFGIIVLNGEPFIRYNLRSLYPFAHEIIVVEGAVRAAANIATPDGHSTDGTLEVLARFKAEEDPNDKIQIVTRDGFWSEKDEQSQAYARRATGDYLWQVDIDEFYRPADMANILAMLDARPRTSAVSFKQITFWGGFDYIADGWYLRRGGNIFRRIFKWGKGYRYVTHRPPTVQDPQGRDVHGDQPIHAHELARRGIFLYHYSLVFPKQVIEKTKYYSKAEWAPHAREAQAWAKSNYLKLNHPFRVHNVYQYVSWLEWYRGPHPPQITRLRQDIDAGQVAIEQRQTADIERLLTSLWYALARIGLREMGPLWRFWRQGMNRARATLDGMMAKL